MKLSVVIPAHNEEGCIESTIIAVHTELERESIDHEILVVNDGSTDATEAVLERLCGRIRSLRYVNNGAPHGFGMAVRCGLTNYRGDAVAIYMADASDSPADLVRFMRVLEQKGVDCVFGSRWRDGGEVVDYPALKRVVNRIANRAIGVLFAMRYDDVTNAFKLYRRSVIDAIAPIRSRQFNLTIELPLKAIARGFSYAVVPNSWTNRTSGESKLRLREMGSRYMYILALCLVERWLTMRRRVPRRRMPGERMPA